MRRMAMTLVAAVAFPAFAAAQQTEPQTPPAQQNPEQGAVDRDTTAQMQERDTTQTTEPVQQEAADTTGAAMTGADTTLGPEQVRAGKRADERVTEEAAGEVAVPTEAAPAAEPTAAAVTPEMLEAQQDPNLIGSPAWWREHGPDREGAAANEPTTSPSDEQPTSPSTEPVTSPSTDAGVSAGAADTSAAGAADTSAVSPAAADTTTTPPAAADTSAAPTTVDSPSLPADTAAVDTAATSSDAASPPR